MLRRDTERPTTWYGFAVDALAVLGMLALWYGLVLGIGVLADSV